MRPRHTRLSTTRRLLVTAMLLCGGAGCGDDGGEVGERRDPAGEDGGDEDVGSDPAADGDMGMADTADEVREPELRQELLDMEEADQAELTGGSEVFHTEDRTTRLIEIIEEHGWPGHDLVGADGASAAWLLAQHSDHDVEFQERALELMREAVADDQADPTDLAYLEDRVPVNNRGPQTYGTQIDCVANEAEPKELVDPDGVDERRAEVGLPPLDDHLAEMDLVCNPER